MNFKEIIDHANRVIQLRRKLIDVNDYLSFVGNEPNGGYIYVDGNPYHYWKPEEVKELEKIRDKNKEELENLESIEFLIKEAE